MGQANLTFSVKPPVGSVGKLQWSVAPPTNAKLVNGEIVATHVVGFSFTKKATFVFTPVFVEGPHGLNPVAPLSGFVVVTDAGIQQKSVEIWWRGLTLDLLSDDPGKQQFFGHLLVIE